MKRIICLIICLMIVSFSSCGNGMEKDLASLKNTITSLQDKNTELSNKISELESENQENLDRISSIEETCQKQKEKIEELEFEKSAKLNGVEIVKNGFGIKIEVSSIKVKVGETLKVTVSYRNLTGKDVVVAIPPYALDKKDWTDLVSIYVLKQNMFPAHPLPDSPKKYFVEIKQNEILTKDYDYIVDSDGYLKVLSQMSYLVVDEQGEATNEEVVIRSVELIVDVEDIG